ncbi:MAG: GntP family permease [Gemmataceae bacterium]|nr:GntP family permease [Gemmataceae bacterium]
MQSFDSYPLVLLGLGVAAIFLLILKLKVHAFLALIGAALLVGFLSPRVVLRPGPLPKEPASFAGAVALAGTPLAGGPSAAAFLVSQQPRELDLLAAPRLVGLSFGSLMGNIGLAIAFATIVGKALMDSGGADRIVRAFTRLFGENYSAFALLVSGFVLAIPVFFDTVFFLLVPLAKALRIRTGKNYLLYVTAIGAGGAITHSLVPPTPGPIAMAANLNVDLGWTIIVGILVGAPLALAGFAYAALANRLWPVPLRQVGGVTLEELEKAAHKPDHELPSLFASMLPIVLPVVLITSGTLFSTLVKDHPDWDVAFAVDTVLVRVSGVLNFLANPTVALLLSAVAAMLMVARQKRMSARQLGSFTAAALDEAGMILLITCAGGSFGAMLQRVGVGDALRILTNAYDVAPLMLAWCVAALFKIAQGSGTVSMIATSEIMRDVVTKNAADLGVGVAEYLGFHPVYLVMMIGAGSKVGSWMNDSGFWVVCKMGGLTEAETFKSWTICLVVMGIVGLPLIWLLTKIVPLV